MELLTPFFLHVAIAKVAKWKYSQIQETGSDTTKAQTQRNGLAEVGKVRQTQTWSEGNGAKNRFSASTSFLPGHHCLWLIPPKQAVIVVA